MLRQTDQELQKDIMREHLKKLIEAAKAVVNSDVITVSEHVLELENVLDDTFLEMCEQCKGVGLRRSGCFLCGGSKEHLHHFVIVRDDLPLGTLAAQVVHAAGESSEGCVPSGTHAVALAVSSEEALEHVEQKLVDLDVPHTSIREPDVPWDGALMAIGIRPMPQSNPNLRQAVGSLPLLKDRV